MKGGSTSRGDAAAVLGFDGDEQVAVRAPRHSGSRGRRPVRAVIGATGGLGAAAAACRRPGCSRSKRWRAGALTTVPPWLLSAKAQPSPGEGAVDTSSRQPSATACLMLSASFGQDLLARGVAAGRPDLGEVRAALGGLGIPLHRSVCGPSFFTSTATWQNRQSTGHQSRSQVALAVALRWPPAPPRRGRIGRKSVPWTKFHAR